MASVKTGALLKMSSGLLIAALVTLAACGSTGGVSSGASFDSAGSAGSGGAGGSVEIAGGAGGSAGSGQAGSGVAGSIGESSFAGCATSSEEAKPLPLDLYIMLDKSGSMKGPRWDAVKQALTDFVSLDGESVVSVGMQFFPLDGSKTCSFEAYAQPEVPIALLPGNSAAIVQKLGANTPTTGETPTLPALQGAVAHAKQWSADHPEHTVAVVLATDGEPNLCASTIENTTKVAKNALVDPRVPVFVVGVGEDLSALDGVAEAGGTSKAILVDGSGSETKAQFLEALNQIRKTAMSCELPLREPEEGTLDPGLVNVTISLGGSSEAEILTRLDAASSCAADGNGWYYDNPKAPQRLVLCEPACAKLKAKIGARVDVVFGCSSIIN